jgi:hypothetical protein
LYFSNLFGGNAIPLAVHGLKEFIKGEIECLNQFSSDPMIHISPMPGELFPLPLSIENGTSRANII